MRTPKTRIMYIEDKGENELYGPARIGRVTFTRTGRTLTYAGRSFQRDPSGFKHNYREVGTGRPFWISGPKKRGGDQLYGSGAVEIDADVREEYWTEIRGQPGRKHESCVRGMGKYAH
jgi:hypothetical protein